MAFNWRKFPWTNLHDLNLDWIIQTVKTLEDNLNDAIGKFTEIANSLISPEREARIAGDAALQSATNTERTDRLAGDAALQTEIENGVYPAINRNINDVNTERTERIAGDAALQTTIDDVIMPRLDSLSASSNSYVLLVTGTESTENDIPLTSEQVTALQNAAQNNYPITMILRDGDSYIAYYPFYVGNTSMMFSRGCNFNSAIGHVDVNQALGRILVASVNLA